MRIQQYIQIIRKEWWVILAILLVSIGGGLAYSYSQTPIYEAEATFVVNPTIRIDETYDLVYSINTLTARTSIATTYSDILESRVILESAIASLNLPPDILQNYDISAVVLPDSNVLLLQIQGPSPYLAADLANTIGTTGLEYISDLQEVYELRRLDLAVVNFTPISPDHLVDVALSAIIGLIGGLAFIILRQFLLQLATDQSSSSEASAPTLSETDNLKDIQRVRT